MKAQSGTFGDFAFAEKSYFANVDSLFAQFYSTTIPQRRCCAASNAASAGLTTGIGCPFSTITFPLRSRPAPSGHFNVRSPPDLQRLLRCIPSSNFHANCVRAKR